MTLRFGVESGKRLIGTGNSVKGGEGLLEQIWFGYELRAGFGWAG